ncbi:MAG: T9SS type A sorting domain-containing protein [Bacteroidota bacterium]
MKLLLSILIFLCVKVHAQPLPLTWSEPLAITNDTSFGSLRPRIAVAENGNVIVTWGKSDAISKVYSARKTHMGSFSSPELISPPSMNCRVAETDGPSITAKGNTVYIVYTSWPFATTHSYSRKSTDGGVTWAAPVQTDNFLAGNFAILPHIAIDHVNNPHVGMVRMTPAGASPVSGVFCSVNQGVSYVSFVPGSTLTAGNSQDCSLPFLTTTGSAHVLLFRNNNGGTRQIFLAKSTNNGATFSSITSVDNTPWNSATCVPSGPEGIILNDTLISVWMSEIAGVKKIRTSATRVSTMSAFPSRYIDSLNVPFDTEQDHPVIAGTDEASHAVGNIVGVTWQQKSATENYHDIALAVSITGLAGLNHAQIINTATTSIMAEKYPAIAYHDSTFHIVYVDSLQNKMYYVSASLRSGTTAVGENESVVRRGFIYPNPARHSVALSHESSSAQLSIYDVLGRLVVVKEMQGDSPAIDISLLPTGLYIYRAVLDRKTIITGKLVKVR